MKFETLEQINRELVSVAEEDVSRGPWKKNSAPRLRYQGIRSSGNLRVFENLAQTLVAVDAS